MQIAVAISVFLVQEHFKVLATVLRFFSPLRNVKNIKISYKPRIGLSFFKKKPSPLKEIWLSLTTAACSPPEDVSTSLVCSAPDTITLGNCFTKKFGTGLGIRKIQVPLFQK